jgi:hypothetical protein
VMFAEQFETRNILHNNEIVSQNAVTGFNSLEETVHHGKSLHYKRSSLLNSNLRGLLRQSLWVIGIEQ